VEKTARLRAVGVIGSLGLLAFAVFATKPGSTYRAAPFFLIPLLWLVYLLRRPLHLHPLHYACFAVALLLHNLGALGWYQKSPLPGSFDVYVHFYFGVVGGLLVYRLLQQTLPLRPWTLCIMTVLLVLGMGAFHELVEWWSTLLLGPEKGMLKLPGQNGVYVFDTQRDMFNNLVGSILAVAIYAAWQRLRRNDRAAATAAGASSARGFANATA
jgi:uncharacterized membrane protein YjdF